MQCVITTRWVTNFFSIAIKENSDTDGTLSVTGWSMRVLQLRGEPVKRWPLRAT